MSKMRVLLCKQWYLNHNYGVQGLNIPLVRKLKKIFPEAEFSILVTDPSHRGDAEFAKEHELEIIKNPRVYFLPKSSAIFENFPVLPSLLKTYKRRVSLCRKRTSLMEDESLKSFHTEFSDMDLVLDTAGIEYIGNNPKKWNEYNNVSFFQLLAKQYDIPYMKYTKSYGPFVGKRYCSAVRKNLNSLPFLFVRGKYNMTEVEKLNLDIPVYSFPDISLSMEPKPKSWAEDFLSSKGIDLSKPLIGISPTAVIKSSEVIEDASERNTCGKNHAILCEKLINIFREQGNQVLILPHSIYDGENEKACDLAVGKNMYAGLKDQKGVSLIDNVDLTYMQVRSIIGLLDFYITGRYHSVCSSIYMGVPTVCLAWHIKYKDLVSMFLDDYLILDCRTKGIEESVEEIMRYYKDQSWFDKKEVKKRLVDVTKEIDKSIDIMVKEIKKRV